MVQSHETRTEMHSGLAPPQRHTQRVPSSFFAQAPAHAVLLAWRDLDLGSVFHPPRNSNCVTVFALARRTSTAWNGLILEVNVAGVPVSSTCQFLHRIQLQILICLGDLHLRLFGRMSTCVQCRAGGECTAVNVKSGEHLSASGGGCWRLGRGSGQMSRLDDVKDER